MIEIFMFSSDEKNQETIAHDSASLKIFPNTISNYRNTMEGSSRIFSNSGDKKRWMPPSEGSYSCGGGGIERREFVQRYHQFSGRILGPILVHSTLIHKTFSKDYLLRLYLILINTNRTNW